MPSCQIKLRNETFNQNAVRFGQRKLRSETIDANQDWIPLDEDLVTIPSNEYDERCAAMPFSPMRCDAITFSQSLDTIIMMMQRFGSVEL